jgi:thiosulfate/3-mercaptopyruvate sulfurtransferase
MSDMNRFIMMWLGLAVIPAASVPSVAQDYRASLLVSASWVAQHLNDPNVVVLHVGPREDYDREHIPGARYISVGDIAERHAANDLVLELSPPARVEQALESLGVSDASRIVVYWGGEWVTPTARVMFTLDWAGLGDRTVLLDGGFSAWKAAGHDVSDAVPAVRRGTLTVRPRPEMVVDADWVQRNASGPGYALVDGRSAAYYDGVRDDDGKIGHIPGAGSVPWTELIDESLLLRNAEQLRQIFTSAGVEPGDTVVAYCHIGQYATMVLFAARTLGYEVRLYDGAFQDWAKRELPLETGQR